ncbi:UNVERIFIED_CONTAM: hypothetical protein HDU68_008453 [Siphonaria sp. JEL0065]|nr:hypothetical protein HDU68_008453 [Siphonaria sp. JEL0065]
MHYGCFYVQLRRNVATDGFTNLMQTLVDVTSKKCGLWRTWNDYDVTWSRSTATLSIYLNGTLDSSTTVSRIFTTYFTSDLYTGGGIAPFYQFGSKLDTVGNADSMFQGNLRDFRVYTNTSTPQFQDRCRNTFGYWKKF